MGRETELRQLEEWLAEDGAAQVHGPPGIGKSTLLRLAAHRVANGARGADGAAGLVFVDGAGRDVWDVLHEIFESCWEAPGYRPSALELRRLMKDVRATVIVDDIECGADVWRSALDALPEATVLYSTGRRLLHDEGRALALGGLGHRESAKLLSGRLGRSLREDEEVVAEALWRATGGAPLSLLRAVAPFGLRRPAELAEVLPDLLAGLTGADREAVVLLALAGSSGAGEYLLGELLGEGASPNAVYERLVAQGLAIVSAHGYRLAPDIGEMLPKGLVPDAGSVGHLADRLAHWVTAPGRTAAETDASGALISGVIAAADRAGVPAAGARLARAASPVVACSLRLGTWGRILHVGNRAAQRAGDKGTQAYLSHEEGVRRLIDGRRVAAAAAFATAGSLWGELGRGVDASAAWESETSCDVPDGGAMPDGSSASGSGAPSGGDADPGGAVDAVADAVGEGAGQAAGAVPPGDPATMGSVAGGGGASSGGVGGLSVTAKVVIGGGLATVVAGGTVLVQTTTSSDTVPVSVTVTTAVAEIGMPGEAREGCSVGGGTTDCTTVVSAKKGKKGPVRVDPSAPLSEGVSILYWGCSEGPESGECTVTADVKKTVCISTTSPEDAGSRQDCARATGSPPASVFRPLAWATGTQVKVLTDPQKEPRVIGTATGWNTPTNIRWSPDRSRVAWAEVRGDQLGHEGVAHLLDLESGTERSWACFGSCGLAFLGEDLITYADPGLVGKTPSDAGIYRYPADGKAMERLDIDGITIPETSLPEPFSIRTRSGLETYLRVNTGGTGAKAALYRLSSGAARRVATFDGKKYELTSVSSGGSRLLLAEHPQITEAGCEEAASTFVVVDTRTGRRSASVTPQPAAVVAEGWFDVDGTAHTLSWPLKPLALHCVPVRGGAGGQHHALAPDGTSWTRASVRSSSQALGVGWQIVTEGGKEKNRLTLRAGSGKKTVLDSGVVELAPSGVRRMPPR
ncbi:hypothetical protein ABZ686_05995 [Streptomyces sp. NPDC006992]|uniref:hypothetical protein n=1 Tax=Streptomyces sp. NPDC006992 TaxID=3155601 RepID=UPI0033C7182A